MKVISLTELRGTEREVKCPNDGFVSFRYLLEKDGMGFSLHRTEIPKGPPQHWNLTTGEWFTITPGKCYVLNDHDNHTFEAIENTVLVSVFNPPVKGVEVHKEDGSYE